MPAHGKRYLQMSIERLIMLTGMEWKVDPQELTNSMMPFQARCASWSMGM